MMCRYLFTINRRATLWIWFPACRTSVCLCWSVPFKSSALDCPCCRDLFDDWQDLPAIQIQIRPESLRRSCWRSVRFFGAPRPSAFIVLAAMIHQRLEIETSAKSEVCSVKTAGVLWHGAVQQRTPYVIQSEFTVAELSRCVFNGPIAYWLIPIRRLT